MNWDPIELGGDPEQKVVNLLSGYTQTHRYGTDESACP